jgi:GNAT superfamily N-acetyltransferase
MAIEKEVCRILDWDCDFFGFRIAHASVNRLTSESVKSIIDWCQFHKIDCLYFLADATDPITVRLAEKNGFRFMDIRLTFENRDINKTVVDHDSIPGAIRPCTSRDIPMLRPIARSSFRFTRFYYDENFPDYRCDDLYEIWTEKSCNGFADAVLVAEIQGQVAGYISCHLKNRDEGQIGLVGVDGKWQGRGVGQALVNQSLIWFVGLGVRKVRVVTQGRNCQAHRLYQRCGFLTRSVELWYHKWFSMAKDR